MPESLRIALLTHSVNPRGGVVHTLELAEALQAAGHVVTVFAPATAGQRMFRPVACELVLVPTAQTLPGVEAMVASRIAAFVAYFSELLQHRSFDLFHAQDSISGNALANLRDQGLIEGFVRTVHHLDVFDNPRLTAWQHRAFAEARQVLCVSRVWQDFLRDEHGIEAGLVHNGVNLRRYSPRPEPGDARVAVRHGLRPGGAVVLAVGGVEERKNTRRLLAAFAALQVRRPDTQLVIAGGASLLDHDAYARAFQADLAASGLRQGTGEDVVLTGPVRDADMPALFRLARVVAMPSLREGFGLVVLEALASGTPVVVSNIAPFTEYLGDAPVAWADPLDVPSITAALDTALQRAPFALPAVCRRFSWPASAAQHLAHYRAQPVHCQA
ncbi:glycosyl transferase family 1 [Rhodoferax koreense]|uniref:Glycosyl transferase family 1 n=1 Tax=Rhodoferax koreensis TaxID=1842727 RepID=A0A1P8K2G6_9BURK|nr:MSMEG_0565 family glycosyltransferase [Rhodoferax koreense]APW40190.1 glycosyl transferase family 1 [Rhodoferax koreense]